MSVEIVILSKVTGNNKEIDTRILCCVDYEYIISHITQTRNEWVSLKMVSAAGLKPVA